MLQIFFCIILLLTSAASAFTGAPMMEVSGRNNGGGSPSTITGITLSNNSFSGGAADGTVVGAITVQGSNNGAATLSITGTDGPSGNNRFRLSSTTVPSNLVLNNTQAAGSYSINLVATLSGATGSPFTQPESITGSGALAAGFFVDVASHGGTCNDSYSNAQGLNVTTPFCSLQRAQTAMRATSTKLTYLRAGNYDPRPFKAANGCLSSSGFIELTTADNGETWQYYPPDGLNTAVIDGFQRTANVFDPNGVDQGFCVTGNNITIRGIRLTAFFFAEVVLQGTGNIIEDSEIDNGAERNGVLYYNNSIVRHNYFHDVNAASLQTGGPGSTQTGLIEYNYISRSCNVTASDCGAIYFQDQQGTSGITLLRNYIHDERDTNQFGYAVYVDALTGGVVSTGNITTGISYSCFFFNGGNNMSTTGQICDLGPQAHGSQAIIFGQTWGPTMSGDIFQNTIVVSNSTDPSSGYASHAGPSPVSSGPNMYHNYHGPDSPQISTTGPDGNDPNPQHVNPKFQTCPGGGVDSWSYKLDPTSPAFGGIVNYPAQTANDRGIAWGMPGYWGPVGFTIPHVGTPPSYGPTC